MAQRLGIGDSGTTAEVPIRDQAAALESAGGDPSLARELLETLLRGLPDELAKLNECYRARDWGGISAMTHHMRGGTSYCGVPALDGALQDLERSAKSRDLEAVSARIRKVYSEATRLRLAFPGTEVAS